MNKVCNQWPYDEGYRTHSQNDVIKSANYSTFKCSGVVQKRDPRKVPHHCQQADILIWDRKSMTSENQSMMIPYQS